LRRNARERCLANDPKNTSAWDDKGQALTHLRWYDGAIECFNQALAVDPQYVNSMVNRGTCYAFTQRYAHARQRYDQVRRVWLDVEEIYDQYDWTGQGLVALAEKRYD
jgi:lipoprotein NlpI